MLMGHYAVALGLKQADRQSEMGSLFLAVQLADIVFFPLVLAGVESGTIVPNFTQSSDLRLDYAPYTHGLLGALVMALIVSALFWVLPLKKETNKQRLSLIMGGAVLSHYLLDVIVHTPDLALVNGGLPKIGLGLWNSSIGTFIVENGLLLVGLWLYLRATEASTGAGKYGMIVFVVAMILFDSLNLFRTPAASETSAAALAIPGLVIYFVMAGVAFWLDRLRSPRSG